MAGDILNEQRITLAQAAQRLNVHVGTIHRWRNPGVRGVKLETIAIGSMRWTSIEALERFVAATTAVADGTVPQPQTGKQRERAIDRAEKELAELGM